MKRSFLLSTLAICAGLVVRATSTPPDAVHVEVKQSFRAGETWMPAGEYSIYPLDTADAMPVLLIESEAGERVLVTASRSGFAMVRADANPSLVFDRVEGKLILKQVRSGLRDYTVVGPSKQKPSVSPVPADANTKQAGE